MDGQIFSRVEQHAVGWSGQFRIAETNQPPDFDAAARQNAGHGPDGPVGVFQCLPQVQEAAALCRCGQTAFHSLPDDGKHGGVFTQLSGVQFRIAARQVQPADVLGQGGVPQGAEETKLGPGGTQGVQRLGVGEAERFVPRYGDAGSTGFPLRESDPLGGRLVGQCFQLLPVQDQGVGQLGKFGLQVVDLVGGLQAQMTAPDDRFRQVGQITQHRQAGLGFQQRLEHLVQLFGAIVEQNAGNMAVGTEIFQAQKLRRQCHTGSFGLDHQQHRKVQRIRQLPRAGPGGQALPVVKAHGSFAHGGTMPGGIVRVQRLHGGLVRKVQV